MKLRVCAEDNIMANHVYFNINFLEFNEQAKTKFVEMTKRIREDGNDMWFGDLFATDDVTYAIAETGAWTCDNVGPKWCYIEEYSASDEDGWTIRGYSAWSPPIEGLQKILKDLGDPSMISSIAYEDEGPNFIGAYVFQGDEEIESLEYDHSDIVSGVIASCEDLSPDSWDSDECEWKDQDAEDIFQDNMYEYINEVQETFIEDTINWIKEQENVN
jgi:hypothetical protein